MEPLRDDDVFIVDFETLLELRLKGDITDNGLHRLISEPLNSELD